MFLGEINGDLVQVSLESLKLELGIQGSIFNSDYEIYGHLATECWVKICGNLLRTIRFK